MYVFKEKHPLTIREQPKISKKKGLNKNNVLISRTQKQCFNECTHSYSVYEEMLLRHSANLKIIVNTVYITAKYLRYHKDPIYS